MAQAAQPLSHCGHERLGHVSPGHGPHGVDLAGSVVLDLSELGGIELDNHAANALIGDEQIRTAAEDVNRRARSVAALHERGQVIDGLWPDE